MEFRAQAERLCEQQQMLAQLKLAVHHAPMRLEMIRKEREKLDLDEKTIKNILASAPARIVQLEAEILSLSPFDNSGARAFEKDHQRRARFDVALEEMLQTIARLPDGSPTKAMLIKEVEAVALLLKSESK